MIKLTDKSGFVMWVAPSSIVLIEPSTLPNANSYVVGLVFERAVRETADEIVAMMRVAQRRETE